VVTCVTMPAAAATTMAARPAGPAVAPARLTPASPPAPAAVLVVDDHPVTREPLARLLRYEGFTARCAANGLEALDSVATDRPDLILLDVMMPKMNGVDFLTNLRADAGLRSIPVIALTGSMDPQQLERLKQLGVAETMTKARFTVEELLDRVRTHVGSDERR
jgi:chemosensory pili system protein ChpA (sensor histidine kinase/response regulator)